MKSTPNDALLARTNSRGTAGTLVDFTLPSEKSSPISFDDKLAKLRDEFARNGHKRTMYQCCVAIGMKSTGYGKGAPMDEAELFVLDLIQKGVADIKRQGKTLRVVFS